MSTETTVAVIGAVALLLGAWIKWRGTRLGQLEKRVDRLERRNRSLWLYCRQLIDHIYRGKGPPPPPWPEDLLDEES